MNRKKIIAGIVLSIILLAIPLTVAGQAAENEPNTLLLAKRALKAIKYRRYDNAILILEFALETNNNVDSEAMQCLEAALVALDHYDAMSAMMFLREAIILLSA